MCLQCDIVRYGRWGETKPKLYCWYIINGAVCDSHENRIDWNIIIRNDFETYTLKTYVTYPNDAQKVFNYT